MGTIQQWFGRCIATLKLNAFTKRHSGLALNGDQAEKLAALYLQQQGLKLLDKNYATKGGEIDLIMRERQCLVFIEVKYRATDAWASAAEAVTRQKQEKIIRAAKFYLQKKSAAMQVECRFDVIAIHRQANKYEIDWLPHAFY